MKESGTYIMLYEKVNLQGKSISEAARETGMSRNTVKKYLREGEKAHQAKGNTKVSKLDPYKEFVREQIGLGIYNATVIFDRICELGYPGGISILKDFIHPLRPPAIRTGPAIQRYETKPGRQAQMDWGIMKYRNQSGRICKVACFVMILGYSRMRYVEFTQRCDEASLLRCMIHAFEYFGGVPEVVLTDRMKTVLTSVDHGKPIWQETFERFATEMGFVPKVCRSRRPQTKGKVERLVHFVRDNFMAGRQFIDFGDLQVQAVSWCDHVNNKIHGTTGERPFDLLKKESLKGLPQPSICRPYRWESRKVARDCFVSFNGARYGVKWRHCGQTVYVGQSNDEVTIISQEGEIIEQHKVCHQSRKLVWAKGQYDGLPQNEGKPYTAPCGIQIAADSVEVRSLQVYEALAEVI